MPIKNQSKIIQRLKVDSEYYGSYGKKFISNSDIETLFYRPQEYGVVKDDNENFARGRLLHQLILEPIKAENFLIADFIRRDAKYKAFCEENNVKFALKTNEANEVKELAKWFMDKDNPKTKIIQDWIRDFDAQYEVPMVKEMHGGLKFKGKADLITTAIIDKTEAKVIIDLKTSGDVFKFMNNAPYYFYDSQAYIYQELYSLPMVFVVMGKVKKYCKKSKKNYYDVGVFSCSDQFIAGGKLKVEKAVQEYNKYHGKNSTEDIEALIITGIL